MKSLKEISDIIRCGFSDMQLPCEPVGLYAPIKYILEDGGKRLRPFLLLLSAESFGADCTKFLNQALAVEIFHNFTLLHDDIMDRAPMRRGRPTVHCKWNDNTAILSGDAMLILSYKLMTSETAPEKCAQLLEIFNKAAMEVCEGQQYDMDFESRQDVSIDSYIEMIRLKTAVLLGASLKLGAFLAGANPLQCQAMYDFGNNLGLAFQIQDDILDTYGDSSVFGKKIGGDILEGKKTFLLISALNKASDAQKKILFSSRDYKTVRGIYDILEVKTEAETAIDGYFKAADDCLEKSGALFLDGLKQMALIMLKRDR